MTNGPASDRFSLGPRRASARAHPGRGGTRLLVGLLVLALVASGVLAYQAYDAAGSHEDVAEQAVTDLAHAAAWQVAERGEMELGLMVQSTLVNTFEGRTSGSRPERTTLEEYVELLEDWEPCGCPEQDAVELPAPDLSAVFRLPVEGEPGLQGLELHGDALDDRDARRLVDTVRAHAEEAQEVEQDGGRATGPAGISFLSGQGTSGEIHAFLHVRVGPADDEVIYGYRVDPEALVVSTLTPLLTARDLLPSGVTGGVPQDSLFDVEAEVAGRTLFRSVNGEADGGSNGGGAPTETATATEGGAAEGVSATEAATATEAFPEWLGGIEVTASVPEERAESVVLGGLPTSRLPLILLLLALTGGLLAMAVVLLRREHQLAQLRSDFVAGVTHELRTPLSQIRMFAELLSAGTLTSLDERRRAVGIIDQESRRLDHLVDNILGFARMSGTGGEALAPVPMDVNALLDEVLERFRPLAEAADAHLERDVEANLEAQADREAVHRVLLNLLDNAVKYGPPGQTVRVAAERDGDWVRIRVDDQGPGVPMGDRDRIWQPYERLPSPVGGATTGSGIGLALVRRLTEAQRGTVEVSDAPAGGARFQVRLPASGSSRAAA